jgi:5-methylcytosine-specific restriction endonuclease McrBC GTP-binding regulatory subunit McrB
MGEYLYMYSDEVLNSLHNEFLNSAENRNLGKSYEVRTVINELLDIDKTNEIESVLVSWFLWKYSTIKGIADEDSPNVILYGPPGTGKTYLVKNSLDFLCRGDRSRYEFVQFHPSFSYEDFIEGIKPKGVTADGNIEFELVNGIFKQFCIRAKENPDKSYYFVIDEINRANLSAVFGEILLCLEKDYRHNPTIDDDSSLIKTQYSTLIAEMIKKDPKNKSLAYHLSKDANGDINAYFGVPKNLYFIGMMNDVDKSIDTFDLALRRRFKWIRKDCDLEVIREETKYRNNNEFDNIDTYVTAAEKLNKYISVELGLGRSYEFGHSFFMKMADIAKRKIITKKNIKQLFDLHMRPTLKEYLRSSYPETELDKVLDEALKKFSKPFDY